MYIDILSYIYVQFVLKHCTYNTPLKGFWPSKYNGKGKILKAMAGFNHILFIRRQYEKSQIEAESL